MSYVASQTYVSVELEKQGISANILEKIFDIDEISAKELLAGTIPFLKSEIEEIANYIGVTAETLMEYKNA